jgi:MSHA biogenesis protein MshL
VNVTTSGTADLWGSIESALEMMVFGSAGGGRRESSGFVRGENVKKLDTGGKSDNQDLFGKNSRKAQRSPEIKSEVVDISSLTEEFRADDQISVRLAEERLKQLVVNEIGGIIVVTDYAENLDKVTKFLNDLEVAIKRQVLIQAHIIEVTLSDAYAMGIDWKVITSNLSIAQGLAPLIRTSVFNIAASGDHFNVLMDAMKEQGQVKMLSSPKVIAMNNQKAIIKLTTKEVSWTTRTTPGVNNSNPVTDTIAQIDEVGIFLDVTPQIDETGRIIMQVHPSVSEVKRLSVSPDGKSNKPVVDIREIDTMVDTKSGDTIVIAGLIVDKLHETKRSVPLLGDIPYLGAFFSYNEQNRQKTELVIFLTPFYLNLTSIEDIRREHEKRLLDIGENYLLINNLGSLATEQSQ